LTDKDVTVYNPHRVYMKKNVLNIFFKIFLNNETKQIVTISNFLVVLPFCHDTVDLRYFKLLILLDLMNIKLLNIFKIKIKKLELKIENIFIKLIL